MSNVVWVLLLLMLPLVAVLLYVLQSYQRPGPSGYDARSTEIDDAKLVSDVVASVVDGRLPRPAVRLIGIALVVTGALLCGGYALWWAAWARTAPATHGLDPVWTLIALGTGMIVAGSTIMFRSYSATRPPLSYAQRQSRSRLLAACAWVLVVVGVGLSAASFLWGVWAFGLGSLVMTLGFSAWSAAIRARP